MALLPDARFDRNEDLQENAEVYFTSLFQDILNYIMLTYGVTEEALSQALVEITDGFRDGNFQFPDVSQLNNLCAYLRRYGSHGSGLTRSRVFEAIRNCHHLAPIINQENLKITSLGGGTGNYAVGFCRALSDCGSTSRNLDIAVVDRHDNWSLCVNYINRQYRQNTAERNIHISFSKIDLRSSSYELYQLLRTSDIILMVKIISMLDFGTAVGLIRDLSESVRNEAIIIYIDTRNINHIWRQWFDILYQSPEEMNVYTSTDHPPRRFGFNGIGASSARISVLRNRNRIQYQVS